MGRNKSIVHNYSKIGILLNENEATTWAMFEFNADDGNVNTDDVNVNTDDMQWNY